MNRSLTRRRDDNREALRAELVDRLMDVVERKLEQGDDFMSITVDNLVTEAEVSKSKFYVYFRDKEDLLHAGFAQVVTELRAISDVWWDLGADITRDRLRAAMGTVLATYRPRIPLLAAAYGSAHLDGAVAAEVAELTDTVIDGLTEHIDRGKAEGWIDREVLARETAEWIVWMAERGQSQMVRHADDAEFEQLVDACSDIIWKALYAPTRPLSSAGS
jgi:AcrR family transcriptional regulator